MTPEDPRAARDHRRHAAQPQPARSSSTSSAPSTPGKDVRAGPYRSADALARRRGPTVRPEGPGRWLAYADPDHESISAMFGGWTAAVVLNAVVHSAADMSSPAALTVNFLGPITPGDDVLISTEHLGGGRSINHWRADVSVRARRRHVGNRDGRVDEPAWHPQPPAVVDALEAPDPRTLEAIQAPGPQGLQSTIRLISGEYASGDSAGSLWVRDAVRARARSSAAGLPRRSVRAALPRVPGSGRRRRSRCRSTSTAPRTRSQPSATTGYSTRQPARGARCRRPEQARLWSRAGALLATTEQLCWSDDPRFPPGGMIRPSSNVADVR